MKYITQVPAGDNTKHIIEVNGVNVEVIEQGVRERYGNKQGSLIFDANGITVSKDLHVKYPLGSNYLHLAQIVLAIEQVRFVGESLRKLRGV